MSTTIRIRKWGNSAGTIIPAVTLAKAGIHLGDELEVEAEEGRIVLKQQSPKYTLDELLKHSSPAAFELDEEGREWLNDEVGMERV